MILSNLCFVKNFLYSFTQFLICSLDRSSLSLILLLRTRSNISSTNYLNVIYVISLIYCFYYSNI
uniref:Uncharacterized protein n=1 Tax=Podoviridae sp. ctZkC8 TaxID=2825259 RepID=A0A8S5UC60_9CAUD|nr:MAG TPA: hypothetical protein [Podoviridae sp. ctZkC8]DAV73855.1 MAG TPA: hypothetical protein [Bacteriophage sp.]